MADTHHTRVLRVALVVMLIAMMQVGTIAGAYLLAIYSIQESQHNWCSALTLLTKHPTPQPSNPSANPSREGEYLFYTDLVTIENRFGC